MTRYMITGGRPLKGKVALCGAKNAGFKAMIGALLGEAPTEIRGLGLISEVELAREVITNLGGKIASGIDPHVLQIDPREINQCEIPRDFGGKSRAVTMYAGPLLARFGRAVLPIPGGDRIGARPIERHLEGLEALGAKVEIVDDSFRVEAPAGLKGAVYRFRKNTHTGTETLILAAAKASGVTVLENAAAEPEVDDLITLLNGMGARIVRLDGRTIKITGVAALHGVTHTVMKDRIEAATFACMALATRGDVEVLGADPLVLNAFLVAVNEAGGRWEKTAAGVRFWYDQPLRATTVTTAPYPGFMTDWQPMWTALATGAQGESVVHETVYESRFAHIADLEKMGGKFVLFNPPVENPEAVYNFNLPDDRPGSFHAVKIYGPRALSGAEIEITDIRRGATLLLAGLAARGETIINDPQDQIKRGYEDLPGRLKRLGAEIKYNRCTLWRNF